MRRNEARTDGEVVAASYDAVAGLYIELFGDEELADPRDLETITAWAATCDGPVLDAGCGPGHWTAALARRGVEVAGVDLSAEFLEHARRLYPALSFQSADVRRLPSRDGSWAGCWHGSRSFISILWTCALSSPRCIVCSLPEEES